MIPTLEIFSQGEEILTGQIVDSNAAWLSEQAVQLGFSVTRHTAVGDKLDDLIALLQEISRRADCCICTGGLGPTTDDLTAEAVAKAFGLPLALDDIAFAQIQQFFNTRNRPMPASNRKQAMLPEGAERLDNHTGTAPGFAIQYERCWFAFLPGVPSEMRTIFQQKIQPTLPKRFALTPSTLISIKTFGIGESDIQQRLNTIHIPDPVQLGFRAGLQEVQTKLLFPPHYPVTLANALVNEIADALGNFVFAIERPEAKTGDLVSVINQLMISGQYTLAVLETASQGLLSSLCVDTEWLLESSYQHSLEKFVQQRAIKFDAGNLPATAQDIAHNIQQTSGADFVLVQLYAGDKIALRDPSQAVILHTTLLAKGHCQHAQYTVAGAIKRKQTQAALSALDVLRRYLQQKTIESG